MREKDRFVSAGVSSKFLEAELIAEIDKVPVGTPGAPVGFGIASGLPGSVEPRCEYQKTGNQGGR